MTVLHRRRERQNALLTYVDESGQVQPSLSSVLQNRPKTRLLLTSKFWITSAILATLVVMTAGYSVRTLTVARDRHASDTRILNAVSDASSELLSGVVSVNSLLSEYRIGGEPLVSRLLIAAREEVLRDLERVTALARSAESEEILLIVESLVGTVTSWDQSLVVSKAADDGAVARMAEIELTSSVGRSIELLQSSLNLGIDRSRSAEYRQTRLGLILGVLSLLLAVGGTGLLVPMAVAGSIERLVVLQSSNKERERRLQRATTSFLDTVNQELRTPLTSISGFSELLSSDSTELDQVQQQRMIQTIYRNSQKMNELVENVLTVMKIQTREIRFKFSEFDARDVLQREVEKRNELARVSGVHLEISEWPEPILMVADSEEVARTLRAVIDNAITYSHRGGQVELSVRRTTDVGEGPMVEFIVTDHGIGIPATELDDVSAAFERGSNAVALSIAGAGLGLAIVDFIVSEHGGEWLINSVEHRGTVVTLRFPGLRGKDELPKSEFSERTTQ